MVREPFVSFLCLSLDVEDGAQTLLEFIRKLIYDELECCRLDYLLKYPTKNNFKRVYIEQAVVKKRLDSVGQPCLLR